VNSEQRVGKNIEVGAVSVALAHDGTRFEGLGEIRHGATILRSGRVPMGVRVRTPDGVEPTDFRLLDVLRGADETVLSLGASARPRAIMEWMVHECRPRVVTAPCEARPRPVDDLTLEVALRPAARRFGPYAADGFVYQYRYRCPTHPVYMLTDVATWEPGGAAVGNTVVQRGGASQAVVPIRNTDQLFTTEWYLPGIVNPNIFQFKPFQTQMQGFTLTVAPQGALVTWATQVAHIRTLLQKARGRNEIEHWHEHCADLGPALATSPMEVLWIPGVFAGAELANLYFHIAETLYPLLHAQAGLRRERISTYGVIEEWTPPDMRRYIEKGAPKLLAAGVKTVFLCNLFENNMTAFGVTNMCCTVEHRVAECVGESNLRAFCDTCHAAGARVQFWGNTAISSLAYGLASRQGPANRVRFLPAENSAMTVLSRAQAPFVRNAFGAIEADHYTPLFCQLNLRDPAVRAYWLDRWHAAREKVGLDGIFLDSSFNMTSDKFHWSYWPGSGGGGATVDQTHLLGFQRPACEPAPEVLSQYGAHLSLMSEMQSDGYEYCGEDTGVFGLHRSGPSAMDRMNSLFLWFDSYCEFNPVGIAAAGADPDEVFFAGLAYRVMWSVYWDPVKDELSWRCNCREDPRDAPTEAQLALLRIYNAVESDLRDRRTLADESGVLYAHGTRRVLWAVRATTVALGTTMCVTDLITGRTEETACIRAEPRHVYRAVEM
jgi:hypothetical protein